MLIHHSSVPMLKAPCYVLKEGVQEEKLHIQRKMYALLINYAAFTPKQTPTNIYTII